MGNAERAIMLGFDGADPMLIKKFLEEDRIPNIKKVIQEGSTTDDYGMTGVVPTVTPPGWCTISTGANPGTHGITCFWNHSAGNPLDQLDYGFLSNCNKVETIWEAYAKAGKKALVVNYPTSYPPKNEDNLFLIDGSMLTPMFNAVLGQEMFYECSVGDYDISFHLREQSTSGDNCVVEGEVKTQKFGTQKANEVDEITKKARSRHGDVVRSDKRKKVENQIAGAGDNTIKTPLKEPVGWSIDTTNAYEVVLPMNNNLKRYYSLLKDSKLNIYFTKKDIAPVAQLSLNEWSDVIFDEFYDNDQKKKVAYKFKFVDMNEEQTSICIFLTCQMNLEEDKYVFPHTLLKELYDECGPVFKVYNYGGPDYKRHRIVMETWSDCHYWQTKAVKYLMNKYKDITLTYTHFHIIDELEHLWIERSVPDACEDWEHYFDLITETYDVMDWVVGEILELLSDEKTALFITSDHALLTKSPKCTYQPMGNAFGLATDWMEERGYLTTKVEDGVTMIDWTKTKATFQRSSYVYINLKGRDPQGIVEPEEYDALVNEIVTALYEYRDPKTGKRVIDACLKRDGMEQVGLWGDNCGDIFFVKHPEFATHHANTWSATKHYWYSTKAIFIACGAGIKKNYVLPRKVHMIDVAPTIATLLNAPLPAQCEGGAIFQMFEDK